MKKIIIIAITGIITGVLYAYLFLKTRIRISHIDANTMRKKNMLGTISRFTLIAGAFWYLLRLPISNRILFLGTFIGSFWSFIFVAQRRYYGRN